MKYLKYFEKDEFNSEIEEEVENIIKNYNPYVVKYEDHKSDKYFSVLVKDKNSNFETWVDLWVEDGEVNLDWNQMTYHKFDSNDMIKKGVESDSDIYSDTYNIVLDKLITDEMIYEDETGYYYYSNYWYIKDGYKDKGINLDDAKRIKKYNL